MNYDAILKSFKDSNGQENFSDINDSYSVLVPLVRIQDELHLLFQVRSFSMKRQPGEICFPGGKIETGEAPEESAIRETMEELNLFRKQVDLIGSLNKIVTPFNMLIHPYCGIIKNIEVADIKFNPQEVAEIFTVPLLKILEASPLIHEVSVDLIPKDNFPYHLIQQGQNYKWKRGSYPVYFYQFQDRIIWGITAKILWDFVRRLKEFIPQITVENKETQ